MKQMIVLLYDQFAKTTVVKKRFNVLIILLLSINIGNAFLIRPHSIIPRNSNQIPRFGSTVVGRPSSQQKLLYATNKNNGPDDDTLLDPILILPIATTISCILLVAGVIYYKLTNPTVGFDLDFYMALDGVIGAQPPDSMTSDMIVGLPALSPAEQLVGALFGPPPSQ